MNKEIYKELEELGSVLSKTTNRDIFIVDSDYFDKMQKSVFSRLEQEKRPSKAISFRFNRWLIGIAASITIIIVTIFTINNSSKVMDDQVAKNDIIEYLNLYIDDLDDTDFAYLLDDSDFVQDETTIMDIDEIEEYLKSDIDNIEEEDLQQLL